MGYDELIDKIKDALKITKLEIYEKADLQAILKEAWLDGYEAGFDEGEENAKRNFDYWVKTLDKRILVWYNRLVNWRLKWIRA